MEQEKLRAYTRIGILLFFSGMFCFVIVMHTGLEDGAIAPMTIYSFISGLLAGKLIDFYMGDTGGKGGPNVIDNSELLAEIKRLKEANKKLADRAVA